MVLKRSTDSTMIIQVSGNDLEAIRIGDEARIKLDKYNNKSFPAYVSQISTDRKKLPKFDISLQITDNLGLTIKPGMAGTGYIKLIENKEWPANLK